MEYIEPGNDIKGIIILVFLDDDNYSTKRTEDTLNMTIGLLPCRRIRKTDSRKELYKIKKYPTFLVVDDGAILHRIEGWVEIGTIGELRRLSYTYQ